MRVYLFGFASDDFLGRVIVTPDQRTVAQLADQLRTPLVEPAKQRLYVEGLNMVKRAVRPQQNQSSSPIAGTEGQLGGVIEREGPIHISNVMLLDAKGNPTRVRIDRSGGKRVRVAKSTGAELD